MLHGFRSSAKVDRGLVNGQEPGIEAAGLLRESSSQFLGENL
jgi:hypothetical protein